MLFWGVVRIQGFGFRGPRHLRIEVCWDPEAEVSGNGASGSRSSAVFAGSVVGTVCRGVCLCVCVSVILIRV